MPSSQVHLSPGTRPVPGCSIRKGLHCSFLSALQVPRLFSGRCFAKEEGCQLKNSSTRPCCCDHTAVYTIPRSLRMILFFQAMKREKGFCQEGMTRNCLWPTGCWHIAGYCLQPSSQVLYSPRVPSPQISSDVLQGLVCSCLLWTFGKAGYTGRQSMQVFSFPGMRVKGGFSNAKKQAVVWGNIFSQCFQITCSGTGE